MPGQSTRPAYHLGPSLSLDRGAPLFAFGECVLIRLPEEIQVEGYVENEATAAGTDLPPVSTGSDRQHIAFVRDVRLQPDRSFVLEVYPVLSFTSTGGALPTYNRMSDAAAKAALLPLPPLSSRHPTPDAFGEPLDFGNWSTYKDSFLHVFPRRLTIPMKRSFKRMDPPLIMPLSVLFRIDSYREYLLSTTNTQNHDDRSHPPPAGAGLAQFSVKPTQSLLILQDVDEDAEDADVTTRDELIMLAGDNPMWMGELRRYLQEEEKEKEWMQNERVARLARWREDMVIQPTC